MSSRKGQRDAARVVREQLARERRRRRTIWVSAAAVVVLVIAGVVGWVVWSNQRSDTFTTPPGANAAGTGIVTGGGPVTVDVYEDFICPACHQFEQTSGATLEQLVADNKAKVVYHPVAYLNRFSTTDYSTRSSAASGCAAAGGKFREYAKALFAKQPPEGSAGLSNDELIDIGAGVGLDRGSFGGCVKDGTYRTWTDHVTDAASRSKVTGTPTIMVNGQPLENPTPDALNAAVAAAGK
ncbi:thioredoxin domain-containing protein [Micromonospora sp. NPDC049101]|uniref:DsbA family protein n=1 Tax=Micromonospora sp. NPDC049101 TaxID=3155032 RepID=UPI0033D4FAC8